MAPNKPFLSPNQPSSSKFEYFARRAALGFVYGGSLGLSTGFLFGGIEAMAMPRGIRTITIAKRSTSFALTFGTIVAVGFVLRS